jgi:hypothetical protein
VGGDQIDYADESPKVRQMFSDALAKHGIKSRMDEGLPGRAQRFAPEGAPGRLTLFFCHGCVFFC